MISRSLISPLSAAPAAAPRAHARTGAAWRERLHAFIGRWRTGRTRHAVGLDALAGLSAHLLRDIVAPDELIARHAEAIVPRCALADLEVRG